MSWMVIFMPDTPALGNVKQFLMTALECTEDQIDESVCIYSCGAENPLKGREVRLSAVNILTKANRPFTKCKFLPGSMNSAEASALHAKEAA